MPKPSEKIFDLIKQVRKDKTMVEASVITIVSILDELYEENKHLRRAVGILVEYAKAGPHRGDNLKEDIENAKQFRKDSEWLSHFLTPNP